jgi:hypothetical protein
MSAYLKNLIVKTQNSRGMGRMGSFLRWEAGEMGRWGDGEMGRWGAGAMREIKQAINYEL